jgi:hypothetical protein
MWFCGIQCAYWRVWAWHPPVGVWIGILGLLGVLVPLIRDIERIGKREKAVWTFIMFSLLLLEIKSVYQDRNEHDEEQAEARERETKNFQSIAKEIEGAIEQSQQHFDATMKKSDKLISVTQESLNNITGGRSYAFVAAGIGPQGPPFSLEVWVKGKYGVHHLAADMQTVLDGRDAETAKRQLQTKHSLPLGNGEFLPGPTPISEAITPGRYAITIISGNQWIQETLDIAQCSDGQWSEAIQMNGPGEKENKKWAGRQGCHRPF